MAAKLNDLVHIDFVTTSHDHVVQCLLRTLTAQFLFSFDSLKQHRRVEEIIGNKTPICHLISSPVYTPTSLRLEQHYDLLERTVRKSSLTKSIERVTRTLEIHPILSNFLVNTYIKARLI